MPRPFAHASTETLMKELVCFVASQGKKTKRGERVPGSTEVLESCFGKMKQLEKTTVKRRLHYLSRFVLGQCWPKPQAQSSKLHWNIVGPKTSGRGAKRI